MFFFQKADEIMSYKIIDMDSVNQPEPILEFGFIYKKCSSSPCARPIWNLCTEPIFLYSLKMLVEHIIYLFILTLKFEEREKA